MDYTTADVFVYQILDCLVTQYDYKIVNVPRNKKDIWLASETNQTYPMIRLNAEIASSAIFEKAYLTKIKSALTMVLNKQAALLILNTNEESVSFVEEDVKQIVITDEKVSDTQLLDIFPMMMNVLKRVENNQEECARLTRHLESNQMHKLKEARKFKWSTAPKVTCVIAAIAVIVFALIQLLVYQQGDDWLATLVATGGYYKALVVHNYEYWRIFTTGFIHYDVITVLFYMLALFQIGKICEKVYSPWKYLAIFLVSLFVGNLFPIIFNANTVSIGLGAGLFGVLASFIVYIRQEKLYKNKLLRIQFNQVILIALLAGMMNGVAFSAQMGGFLTGLFMSVLFYNGDSLKIFKKHFAICGIILVSMVGYYALQVKQAYPQINELDEKIADKYRAMGFKGYADKLEKTLQNAYEE